MNSLVILEGIIIGAVGGSTGGFILSISNWSIKQIKIICDKRKIYNWLVANSKNQSDYQYRSTKSISSYTNLPYERVNFICSIHTKIKLSTGNNEELWEILKK